MLPLKKDDNVMLPPAPPCRNYFHLFTNGFVLSNVEGAFQPKSV